MDCHAQIDVCNNSPRDSGVADIWWQKCALLSAGSRRESSQRSTGFVNSAGTAGPIRTEDGSFDAPERRNDKGSGHVAPRATWHVPRAAAWTLRKMLCQGCSPNGKWPGVQTFRSEAPWSELCVIGKISPEGSKLCPQGAILLFSAFCPLARTPLDLGTPNLVHGCTWARAIRICIIYGIKKNWGDFWIFFIFLFFLSFFIIRPKMLKMTFLENSKFWPPLLLHILKALVALYPCTKFREISTKGVGARGHKAETQNCALRAQFWPLGVVTYIARVPHQGASTLKVWGLCDLPRAAYPNVSPAQLWLILQGTLAPPCRCSESRGE